MYEDLIKERKRLKLTKKQLCKAIGYSEQWVKQFEWGERRVSERFIKAYSDGLKRYKTFLEGGKNE